MLRAIECYGISSVYGIRYLGRGNLPTDTYIMYVRHDYLARDLVQGSLNYVPTLRPMFEKITVPPFTNYFHLKKWFVAIDTLYNKILIITNYITINRNEMMLKNENRETAVMDAISYFDVMTSFMEELGTLQKELRILIRYVNKWV